MGIAAASTIEIPFARGAVHIRKFEWSRTHRMVQTVLPIGTGTNAMRIGLVSFWEIRHGQSRRALADLIEAAGAAAGAPFRKG